MLMFPVQQAIGQQKAFSVLLGDGGLEDGGKMKTYRNGKEKH